MAQAIAICNLKGGTAKTTTAQNLAAGLHKRGFKTLAVDLDAQGNLGYTMNADTSKPTLTDLLQQTLNTWRKEPQNGQQITLEDATTHTQDQGAIIASSEAIGMADTVITDEPNGEFILASILEAADNLYDYVIIDCPPNLGTLTVNALEVADYVIVPTEASVYSYLALSRIADSINTVKKNGNPGLTFKGILLTRFNPRTIVSQQTADSITQAAAALGTQVFNTRIRESTPIKESQYMRQSIFDYAPRSNAAKDYNAFIEELLPGSKN